MRTSTRSTSDDALEVAIRPWAEGDLDLLQALLGDPEMTRYLGGPESEEKLRSRHQRYLRLDESGAMFVITVGPEEARLAAGSVGYWQRDEGGAPCWETGWSVLPAWQGRGLAVAGTRLALEHAAADGRYRWVHAYPSVDNVASNRVCEKLGFELVGSEEFEYPKGHWMRCNDWKLALWRDDASRADLSEPAGSTAAAPRTGPGRRRGP